MTGGSKLSDSDRALIRKICEDLKRFTYRDIEGAIYDRNPSRRWHPTPDQIRRFLPTVKWLKVVSKDMPQVYEYVNDREKNNRFTLKVLDLTDIPPDGYPLVPGSYITPSTLRRGNNIIDMVICILEK